MKFRESPYHPYTRVVWYFSRPLGMQTLITHPDNYAKLCDAVQDLRAAGNFGYPQVIQTSEPMYAVDGLSVITSEFVPKDRTTGKYILPNGWLVERGGVRVQERFVEYGPEDLSYLLYSGKIQEHRELLVFILEQPNVMLTLDSTLRYKVQESWLE